MLFSLYNTKTDAFTRIFEAETHDEAQKIFMGVLQSSQPNEISMYIDEYVLYQLGDFDKSTGEISVCPAPISVCNGLTVVQMWKARKKLLDEIYSTPSPAGDEAIVDIPKFMKGDETDDDRKQVTNIG